jgi:hypothetical protein
VSETVVDRRRLGSAPSKQCVLLPLGEWQFISHADAAGAEANFARSFLRRKVASKLREPFLLSGPSRVLAGGVARFVLGGMAKDLGREIEPANGVVPKRLDRIDRSPRNSPPSKKQ